MHLSLEIPTPPPPRYPGKTWGIRGDLQVLRRLISPQGVGDMVGEMVQNSQSLYSFTFNALIDIHEYIYSHSTTEFTFKKYIYSHLPVYFLSTIIFAHIYEMSSFTFNELYSFTFTIEIFIQHFLRITFAHLSVKIWTADYGLRNLGIGS